MNKMYLLFFISSFCIAMEDKRDNFIELQEIVVSQQSYESLTPDNMFEQWQEAYNKRDPERMAKCKEFIKNNAVDKLTPPWKYFLLHDNFLFEPGSDEERYAISQSISTNFPQQLLNDPLFNMVEIPILKQKIQEKRDLRRDMCQMTKTVFCAIPFGGIITLIVLAAAGNL